MAATGNWIDTDGVLLGGVAVPADEADSVLFDLGDLRMEVVDVSNCLFTEFVARFCFFTGTEDAGGDGDSGELSSDGKVGIFITGVVRFFSFWEHVFFGRDGSLLPSMSLSISVSLSDSLISLAGSFLFRDSSSLSRLDVSSACLDFSWLCHSLRNLVQFSCICTFSRCPCLVGTFFVFFSSHSGVANNSIAFVVPFIDVLVKICYT